MIDPLGKAVRISFMNCATEIDFPRAMLGTTFDFDVVVDCVVEFTVGTVVDIDEKFTARIRV